jgi:quercetin dioxygenase-like cupin family protein
MRVVRISEVHEEPSANVSPVAGWTGGPVTRTHQEIIPPSMSTYFNCGWRNFSRGATERFHTHTVDQLLIITAGIGIVATEQEEREVTVGDIVHLPAGERHCHGATKESYMSYITITSPGGQVVFG